MAPATAGAVLFRSRPSAASPLPDGAQEGQLKGSASHQWVLGLFLCTPTATVSATVSLAHWSMCGSRACLVTPSPSAWWPIGVLIAGEKRGHASFHPLAAACP
jgi:hypothetical protein